MLKPIFEQELQAGTFQVFNEIPPYTFVKVKQIHSAKIISDEIAEENYIEADGIIGTLPLALGILTADCLPIVIEGKKGHVILHAGWRGIANNIFADKQIRNILPYYAFIGPHIQKHNYEVSPDFFQNFKSSHQTSMTHFDLSAEATSELQKLYPQIYVENSSICTYDNGAFHSYRRNKTTLRNYNIYLPFGVTHEI